MLDLGFISAVEAIALLGLLALGIVLGLRWSAWRVRRRIARHRDMGAKGEQRAVRMLERAGYIVEVSQPSAEAIVSVDGEVLSFRLRGDLIVRQGGQRYLAEVKSGQTSASIRTSATRRQLLDYALAFDVDGVLLVDVHAEQIRQVSFPALDGDD